MKISNYDFNHTETADQLATDIAGPDGILCNNEICGVTKECQEIIVCEDDEIQLSDGTCETIATTVPPLTLTQPPRRTCKGDKMKTDPGCTPDVICELDLLQRYPKVYDCTDFPTDI